MDVLLEISYFPTPHTAQAITEVIKKAIQKWEIESQIISITADNGANIVAAIRDLEPIKKLSCAAYTLQLPINKGLKVVEDLVSHGTLLI
ncbi:zinc finger BED domain-containing protein 1-like [Rhizophagus irregularis DAOM 181602=DAOM 197198]|nr:zinc finger BED domain-containing protein 1-like [Rhizophagus irregularis DAOM 181602=DAOM 197198]